MTETPITERATSEGRQWASQFLAEGADESKQENLRGMIASAYAAGWLTGYAACVPDLREQLGLAS